MTFLPFIIAGSAFAVLVTVTVEQPKPIIITPEPAPIVDTFKNDLPRAYNPQPALTMEVLQ